MGCRWVTIRGVRQRVGPVEPVAPPETTELRSVGFWDLIKELFRRFIPHLSPPVDWDRAILRVHRRVDDSILFEFREHSGDMPIYHGISEDELQSILKAEATPELLIRLVRLQEPVME